jgi:putative addiction module component (TIGR02574 family)
MILESIPEVRRLTPAEKLQLVSELWDDLASQPANVPVSAEIIAELDRRMAEYHRDPSRVTSWEAIQRKLLGRTLSGE